MKTDSSHTGLRTWIEIDESAFAHNYAALRGLLKPGTRFMAVVKSNAYGHSLHETAKIFEKLGADWIGVDSIVEAEALREAGIKKPLFVLGLTLPEKIAVAAEQNISLAVSTFEMLDAIDATMNGAANASGEKAAAQKLKIHIKVDTGMHRQGFQEWEIEKVIERLKSLPASVVVEGLFTHFGAAKNPSFRQATQKQLDRFALWRKAFEAAGIKAIVHAAASGGAMIFPESHFDLVRFGIATYGLWPSAEARAFMSDKISLKPVLSWKTCIGEVKQVKKGERVGYDFTEEFSRDSKIAICPIGYWHGFPRALSSIGRVLVHGREARILGRVSMDMMTIDLTDIPDVKVFDEVVIVGAQEGREATIGRLADLSETSNYEFVTRINPLIKRIII